MNLRWTQTQVCPVVWILQDDAGVVVAIVTKDTTRKAPYHWRYDVTPRNGKPKWGIVTTTMRAKRIAQKIYERHTW